MGVQFLWRIFTIAPRVAALSLFASEFHFWVFPIVGVHYAVMLLWIIFLETHFCDRRYEEILFNIVCAVVYIFCYFNLIEGHTRWRYIIYYTIMYLENAGLILAWFYFVSNPNVWYRYPAIILVLLGFFLGLTFMVMYYILLHPTKHIQCCLRPPICDPRMREDSGKEEEFIEGTGLDLRRGNGHSSPQTSPQDENQAEKSGASSKLLDDYDQTTSV